MIDLLKNTLFSGVGVALLTRDRLNDILDDMVERGTIRPDEAEELRENLMAAGKDQWTELREWIAESIRVGRENLDIPQQTAVDELERRIADLERRHEGLTRRLDAMAGDENQYKQETDHAKAGEDAQASGQSDAAKNQDS